ncbi:PQQ-binding-like beta-propeller repeat protein [Armatimonas sp.]|uniref:outer membrane protein assembly factor BamB family protein n=1 Tax=Armatimonas sp. TaxID=1872638 RepID=UPI00286AB6EE|nr:PQQ-binding-like beta-propeller repeat protein [Armatimonas sp.]
MTRFVFLRTVPRALCASAIALSLVVPLTGCGGGLGRPFGGGVSAIPSRKVGTIDVTVTWPEVTRLIPDASNSIVVNITDSRGRNAPGFPRTLVRPTNFSGSSPTTTTSTTATNLEVGVPGTPENYTITASAFPNTTGGGGAAQATGGTVVGLDTDNPTNSAVNFTLGTTIRSVEISITDGSTSGQNLGKDRTRAFLATARDATNAVVLTTPSKWKWDVVAPGIGNFQGTGTTFQGNGATYVAGDPGSVAQSVTIQVTETEASASDSANPTRYTTTTAINIVPLGLSDSEWARFRGSKQNLGVGTAGTSIASSVSQLWSGPLSVAPRNVVFSSVVVDKQGVLYLGGYNEATGTGGVLYAINPDGTLKWSYAARGRIESSPLVSRDGTIYFGSYDDASGGGFLYGIKSNTAGTAAQEVWVRQTAGPVFGSPALDSNGYLYYGTGGTDRKLYKADSLNGIPVVGWQFMDADPAKRTEIQTSPALSDDEATVYFASAGATDSGGGRIGAKLYAVNTNTAARVWEFDTVDKSVTMSSPVVSGGKVFFGTLEGLFFAVDQATGTLGWASSFDAEAQIYATAAMSPDGSKVYFATFDNISGIDKNRVVALNSADGSLSWETPSFTAGFTSSPAVSKDGTRLYLGCYDGNVYGINTSTGATAWTFMTGTASENFDSSPCIGPNGNVYIGSFRGNVYALK